MLNLLYFCIGLFHVVMQGENDMVGEYSCKRGLVVGGREGGLVSCSRLGTVRYLWLRGGR